MLGTKYDRNRLHGSGFWQLQIVPIYGKASWSAGLRLMRVSCGKWKRGFWLDAWLLT